VITRPLRQYRAQVLVQCQLAREIQHLEHASRLLKEGRPERARASEAALGLAEARILLPEHHQALSNWDTGFSTWPTLHDHGDRLWWLCNVNHRGLFPFTQGLDPVWERSLQDNAHQDIEIACDLNIDSNPLSKVSDQPQRQDVPVTRLAQSLVSAFSHIPMQEASLVFETRVHLKLLGSDAHQLEVFAQLARKTWSLMLKTHFKQGTKAQQLLVLKEFRQTDAKDLKLTSSESWAALNQTPWETLSHLESATWDAMDAIATLDDYGAGDEPTEFEDE